MEKAKKGQFEPMLEVLKYDNGLIEKLVIYLKNNNLIDDFFQKTYYTIKKDEPICKIRYYKDENGKLLSLYDIKNSDNLINECERCSVYVYDEIKTLFFAGHEISKKRSRIHENSKSYNNLAVKILPLNSCDKLVNFIKLNPLLFVYAVTIYDIELNDLANINEKSYTYNKEIKNN